jgi:spermidine/putrescine transport system ATP-binding protein
VSTVASQAGAVPSIAVQAIDVTKRFADNVAVNNINLTIESGEFFSLLGPSGCGKTTLLRMIAGFEQPTSGKLLISGQDMTGRPPHKRQVNMVFQNYALFPHMTVTDNIGFGLDCKGGIPKAEIKQKVAEALDLVRLKHLADRFPSQLSGGQQQRIALARAVINRPNVLLLDEPLSALDPQIREEMQSELSRLQRELALTFVMVTHDQNEALALSHHIAVFSRGNLEQVGTPTKVYEEPETLFVAEFIGQTNLLKGTVLSVDPNWVQIELAEGSKLWASRRLSSGEEHARGSAANLWVKPHAIRVLSIDAPRDSDFAGNGSDRNGSDINDSGGHGSGGDDSIKNSSDGDRINLLEATVVSVNYQGYLTEYIMQTADNQKLRATKVNAHSGGTEREFVSCIPGQKVLCRFLASDCSYFCSDARTLVESKA